MTRNLTAKSAFLAGLLLVSKGWAQVPPPPGPAGPPAAAPPPAAPPPAAPPPAAPPASDPLEPVNPDVEPPPGPAQPPPAGEPPGPAQPPAPTGTQSAQPPPAGEATAGGAATAEGGAAIVTDEEAALEEERIEREQRERLRQRKTQSALEASTGIFRTHYAGSGPVGTFRFGLLTSYFTDEAFLCPQCSDADGGPGSTPDNVSRIGAHLFLSATPLEFLEAYLAAHSTATSNSRGNPELLQVLGDTTWGVKAFLPPKPDQAFTAGAAAELWLLNGTGGVGVDRASFALRGLTSLDFSNRSDEDSRVPLRINFNLSYLFDNSGKLVEDIEAERNRRITRVERYGLNVNRVDRFTPAFGFEGMFEVVRPYLGWSVDVPTNRQNYRCAPADVFASDVCLDNHVTFESAPSRLTLGARAYAFLDGLAFHAALDLGTGGTTPPFWEEVQPETPWNLYFGVGYAADTKPKVEVKRLASAPLPVAEEPGIVVNGLVVEAGTQTGIANAIVRYQGRPLTGMVTDESGRFITAPLDDGSYTFNVTAEDYEDGTCSVQLPPSTTAGGATPENPQAAAPATQEAAQSAEPQANTTQLRCELKAKPLLGAALVYAVDQNDQGIPFARITATDSLGRPLSLEADDQGAVAFVNVVPGKLTLVIEAEGYLRASEQIEIKPKTETRSQVTVFERPKRPSLKVGPKEISLQKPIEFAAGTAEILLASEAVVDELAELLRTNPNLGNVEIQAHTDNQGSPERNLQLSTQRANVVRDMLIRNGVPAGKLLARGYGDTEPKAPNTSDQNRKRNNRIELHIKEATVLP